MKGSMFTATTLLIALAIMITFTTATRSSTFTFVDFSPVTELVTFEIDLGVGLFQGDDKNNIFSFDGGFAGLKLLSQDIYGYGIATYDNTNSFRSDNLKTNITIDSIGHADFFFEEVSFPSRDFAGHLTSLKFRGTFNAQIIRSSDVMGWGTIKNLITDMKGQWDPTYPKFNRPLAQYFDFISTPKVDPFGRNYNSFKLIVSGVNQDLIIGQGISLGSFELIESTPNQAGQQQYGGRFSPIDPQELVVCRIEESGSIVTVSLSDDTPNVLSIHRHFFHMTRSQWTMSCDNIGYYPPKSDPFFFSSSQKRLAQRFPTASSSTALRLVGVTEDNQRYIVDKWN